MTPKNPKIAPLLFCVVILAGCTHTVTWQQLQREASKHAGATFPDTTFYCGSKSSYDYFYIQPGFQTSISSHRDYRVVSSASLITNRFEFTTDRQRWVSYLPLAGLTEQQLRLKLQDALRQSTNTLNAPH